MSSIKLKVGIIGVTGLVGKKILEFIDDELMRREIKVCASNSNVGSVISVNSHEYILEKLCHDFFENLDVVFFCADDDTSIRWVPVALNYRLFVIDSSSAFRTNNNVNLIIPEINGHLLKEIAMDKTNSKNKICNIVASPNCCATLLCMILYPLTKLSNITRVDVDTYQAVSGAGIRGIEELEKQTTQYCMNEKIETNIFKSQIYGNCFSHNSKIDETTKFCEEELKISFETKKIIPTISEISATCVRIPVYTSHSESVKIVFENSVDEKDIFDSLNNFSGVTVINDNESNKFPEPIIASDNTDVFVGRIRRDLYDTEKKIYKLFICGDQLLKGASWNSFQIFKTYEKYFREINDASD